VQRLISLVVAGLLPFGCERDGASLAPLSFDVFVESDPGHAVSGVSVAIDGRSVGSTDATGRVRASRSVTPGQVLTFSHSCPAGFVRESEPRVFRARSYLDGRTADGVSLTLRCQPERRLAIFVIWTRGVGAVDVLVNGERTMTTDADGVAHLSRRANPGSDFLVELVTDSPRVRPKKVSRMFTLRDSDQIFVFDQPYRARAVRRRRPEAKPRIVRIE
jgi:hypothetical protein